MKKKRLHRMLIIASLLLCLHGFAQQTIKGNLQSPSGEPLVGATITVKGTTRSVVTDSNGNFIIEAEPGAVLVASSVGFQERELTASASFMKETMQVTDAALSEVVVIGYQTIRRKDATGALSSINTGNSNRVSANSIGEQIQGLAAGVNVRTGGGPGQNPVIEIRGVASFTNASPLYVIDGMIADANSTINSNDVASIQILKDASAAAIYGSRAANGVVIITTRQGRAGPVRVSVSVKGGVQMLPKQWDLADNVQFANLQKTQYTNSGATPPASVGSGFDPSVNTDWQDEVVRMGNMQDYNVSLSGGSNTSTYLISGSYFKNQGVLIGNSFDRASMRINSRTQKGRVSIGENLVFTNSNTWTPNEGNPFYDFPQLSPVIPVQGAQYVSATNPRGFGIGSLDAPNFAYNSVAVNALSHRKVNYAKILGNAYADVKIFNWLSYRFNAGLEASFDYAQVVRELGIWQQNAAPKPSSIDEERSRFTNMLLEHTLNFNKTFGQHSLNGVIGYTQQKIRRETTSGGRSDLEMSDGGYLTTIGSALGTSTAGGGSTDMYNTYGYLGRINYSFADKYFITGSGRVDQDSRFGANNRTGFFPSVALAWRINNESFFKSSFFSDLKLRVSYGELGIVPLGSWDYLSFINNSPRFISGPDQAPLVGSTQARLANPDLKWEERSTRNIGVDASILDNHVSFTVEVYNSLSKDALVQLPVGGYLGNLQGDPFVNAGSIRNTGVEFSATYRQPKGAFQWDVSANFTTINNKVEDVGNRGAGIDYITSGETRTKVGESLGEFYLIRTNGLFQSQQEVDNYKNKDGIVIQPDAKPGDVRYVDLDGDGNIDADDRTLVGSPWPKVQAGAQFNASWKRFTLNLQVVGVFGNKIYNDVRRILDSYQNTNFRAAINPWSPTNTNTNDPRLGLATDQGINDNNRVSSDRWLESGSYFRLRNVEIGYGLSANSMQRIGITSSRIFVSAQNVFTITKYKGLDPDVVGNGLLQRGFDSGNWPASRIISAGIQCEF